MDETRQSTPRVCVKVSHAEGMRSLSGEVNSQSLVRRGGRGLDKPCSVRGALVRLPPDAVPLQTASRAAERAPDGPGMLRRGGRSTE